MGGARRDVGTEGRGGEGVRRAVESFIQMDPAILQECRTRAGRVNADALLARPLDAVRCRLLSL